MFTRNSGFMKENCNVCIAGATGFVGKNFVDYLTRLPQPPAITCLVRSSSDTSFLADYPVTIETVDFLDKSTLQNSFRKADYVYNLVGMTAGAGEQQLRKVNRDISATLLHAYLDHKDTIKGYFLMSTLAVVGPRDYGHTDPTRTDNLMPLTAYGRTKREGEQLHWPYVFEEELNIAIVRAPGIYGQWDREVRQYFDIVKNGITPIIGNGETKVTLINISDLVRFMERIIIDKKERGIFYVYDGRIYNMAELGTIARKILRPRSLKVQIPEFVLRSVAFLNEKVNRQSAFNKEKCKEMLSKDWAYEQNDFPKCGETIQFDLEQSIHALYVSQSN
ncbi:MAG: hypothetical protein BRD50_02125 [Bacteroidetes bacterium SW_11_45_7]|nr:MAG: hypothetical protein BRD50_02125 [Bacteroidetes bacterium SW_11_45_7]